MQRLSHTNELIIRAFCALLGFTAGNAIHVSILRSTIPSALLLVNYRPIDRTLLENEMLDQLQKQYEQQRPQAESSELNQLREKVRELQVGENEVTQKDTKTPLERSCRNKRAVRSACQLERIGLFSRGQNRYDQQAFTWSLSGTAKNAHFLYGTAEAKRRIAQESCPTVVGHEVKSKKTALQQAHLFSDAQNCSFSLAARSYKWRRFPMRRGRKSFTCQLKTGGIIRG